MVEPGLLVLRRDAMVPTWLGLPPGSVGGPPAIQRTGQVKSYARPDRTKGLHLLPEVFSRLEEAGYACSVALGDPLDGDAAYADDLRRRLGPWLEEGPRTSAWIEPGDVFVVPSVSGEAACLSAQEAVARGAWVVASRIGLMPLLAEETGSMTGFSTGDVDAASDAVLGALRMDQADFEAACLNGHRAVTDRAGRWYAEVRDWMLARHATLAGG